MGWGGLGGWGRPAWVGAMPAAPAAACRGWPRRSWRRGSRLTASEPLAAAQIPKLKREGITLEVRSILNSYQMMLAKNSGPLDLSRWDEDFLTEVGTWGFAE